MKKLLTGFILLIGVFLVANRAHADALIKLGALSVSANENIATFMIGSSVRKGDSIVLKDIYQKASPNGPFEEKNRSWNAIWDGSTRNIVFRVPFGSFHALSVSVIPITKDGRSYCGLEGSSASVEFSGSMPVKPLPRPSQKWQAGQKQCMYYVVRKTGLRIDVFNGLLFVNKPTGIYEGPSAPKLDVLKLSASNCEAPTGRFPPFCQYTILEKTNQSTLLIPVSEATGACAVEAVAYTEDQGRIIAAEASSIDLNGVYCPNR